MSEIKLTKEHLEDLFNALRNKKPIEPNKEEDLKDREENAWMDVELFRIVHGRLPGQEGDDITKRTAKQYLDRFYFGQEKFESRVIKQEMNKFAFHVYASTNLAYEP